MTTSQAPVDATHQWLPAVNEPFVTPWCFRRAYYKRIDGEWWSYNIYGKWVKSGNDQEWFDEGVKLGEFVEIK